MAKKNLETLGRYVQRNDRTYRMASSIVKSFRAQGYNVLAWSATGHGDDPGPGKATLDADVVIDVADMTHEEAVLLYPNLFTTELDPYGHGQNILRVNINLD